MSQTKQQDCIFCNKPESKMVFKNEFAYAVRDGHPVTELHTLIIPRRCVPTYFDLTENEIRDCQKLLKLARRDILNIDKSVTGFNIGINVGKDAGQSIFHCHIHLIPRRKGDVEEPRGGVRGVIPHKQKY